MGTWFVSGLLSASAGAILIAAAAIYAVSMRRFAARAVTTLGTVVDLVTSDGSDSLVA